MRIDENSYLEIRALCYAVDKCLQEIYDSDSVELENALMLSAMLIKNLEDIDKK